jgi:hypothetical protein
MTYGTFQYESVSAVHLIVALSRQRPRVRVRYACDIRGNASLTLVAKQVRGLSFRCSAIRREFA